MSHDIEAARARAEARFKKPQAEAESEAAKAERELRERTERLRAARLADEALKRKGAEIRASRRRGS
jgi:hypothetical protein